jgi:hypothetical protein
LFQSHPLLLRWRYRGSTNVVTGLMTSTGASERAAAALA